MTYRIHRYLDGDLPSEELTEEERREAEEYRRVVDQTVPLLRAERSPDLSRRVMRRISHAPRKSLQDRALWLVILDEPVTAEGGTISVILVDFDVNENFVIQGNPHTPAGMIGVLFTPALRELSRDVD